MEDITPILMYMAIQGTALVTVSLFFAWLLVKRH